MKTTRAVCPSIRSTATLTQNRLRIMKKYTVRMFRKPYLAADNQCVRFGPSEDLTTVECDWWRWMMSKAIENILKEEKS